MPRAKGRERLDDLRQRLPRRVALVHRDRPDDERARRQPDSPPRLGLWLRREDRGIDSVRDVERVDAAQPLLREAGHRDRDRGRLGEEALDDGRRGIVVDRHPAGDVQPAPDRDVERGHVQQREHEAVPQAAEEALGVAEDALVAVGSAGSGVDVELVPAQARALEAVERAERQLDGAGPGVVRTGPPAARSPTGSRARCCARGSSPVGGQASQRRGGPEGPPLSLRFELPG